MKTFSYQGVSVKDNIARIQVEERAADADGVLKRNIGYIELDTPENAAKLLGQLKDGKKTAELGPKLPQSNFHEVVLAATPLV